jgi:hypothetical protein
MTKAKLEEVNYIDAKVKSRLGGGIRSSRYRYPKSQQKSKRPFVFDWNLSALQRQRSYFLSNPCQCG